MTLLEAIESGNVFGAMVRGPIAPPYTLTQLVAAGLHGIAPIDPIKSSEVAAVNIITFRARFTYTWSEEDDVNPPAVLAAVLGDPPTMLLFAASWSVPAGFVPDVGAEFAVPIFLSIQPA